MCKVLNRFLSAESGATAIEYSMIAAFIATALIAAAPLLGLELANVFGEITAGLALRTR